MTEPREIARKLLLLTALQKRIKEVDSDLRDALKESTDVGSVVTYTLPNPENPKRPLVVGTATMRRGATVARVADENAWKDWVKANAPTEFVETTEGVETFALGVELRTIIDDAVEAYNVAAAAGDWADPAADFCTTIRAHGMVLREGRAIPAESKVRPVFEEHVLKATVTDGKSSHPGITVSEADPTLAVKLSPDGSIVKAFLGSTIPGELDAIAGGYDVVEIKP